MGWSQSGGQPIFLSLAQGPKGSVGVRFGLVGVAVTDLSLEKGASEKNR